VGARTHRGAGARGLECGGASRRVPLVPCGVSAARAAQAEHAARRAAQSHLRCEPRKDTWSLRCGTGVLRLVSPECQMPLFVGPRASPWKPSAGSAALFDAAGPSIEPAQIMIARAIPSRRLGTRRLTMARYRPRRGLSRPAPPSPAMSRAKADAQRLERPRCHAVSGSSTGGRRGWSTCIRPPGPAPCASRRLTEGRAGGRAAGR
jgi:hypothetical protein